MNPKYDWPECSTVRAPKATPEVVAAACLAEGRATEDDMESDDTQEARDLITLSGRAYQHRPTPVSAIRAHKDFRLDTDHGVLVCKTGVWLVTDHSGEVWPLSDEKFAEKYAPHGGFGQAEQEMSEVYRCPQCNGDMQAENKGS